MRTNYTFKNLKQDGIYNMELTFCSNGGDGPSASFSLQEDVVNGDGMKFSIRAIFIKAYRNA